MICDTIAFSGTLRSTRVGLTTGATMLRGLTKPAVPGLGSAVSSKKRDGWPVAGTCLMRWPNGLERRQMSKISVWYKGTSIAPGPMKSAAAWMSAKDAFIVSRPLHGAVC